MKFGNYPDIDIDNIVDVKRSEDGNSYTIRYKDWYKTPRPEVSSLEIDAFTAIEVLDAWAHSKFEATRGEN